MIVSSKQLYYKLAETYKFGNRFRTWDGVNAWLDSGYDGPIRFRSKVPGSKLFTTGKPYEGGPAIMRAYEAALQMGESPGNIIFCEPAPEEHLTFQGEVCEGQFGELCLTWSTEPGITNREAMTRPTGRHSGLSAHLTLKHFLDPEDHEWLIELLHRWPGHAVEFSAYSIRVGLFESRMVVWEVRYF